MQGQIESLKGRVNWLFGIVAAAIATGFAFILGKIL